ncbi:MAG: TlpA family protein disulfide reductase [Crocinitomicaceae bacterium]
MDELEKIVKENKASFDRLELNEDTWDAINSTLDTKKKPTIFYLSRKRRIVLSVAATIILLIGISPLFTRMFNPQSQFENLLMTSPNGEKIQLDPSLNKYTLIQFWASGNVLCDKRNCYYYLPAYEKYKDKGFEIYAISLDKNKDQWVNSIEENDLPWIHVSDLKGWESPICIECNISKIPTSYLLDQEGNIVMEDLNAEILDETLSKLLADN